MDLMTGSNHTAFAAAYARLNDEQRRAVDQIDGPLLVIAGPGTGKTQLLGTRAAQIVNSGVANPNNILCLTYTDTAATELRARLGRIMGVAGGEVAVHTFHSFGSWIIREHLEASAIRSRRPLDALGRYHVVEALLAALPLRHPFAQRGDDEAFSRQSAVTAGIEAFKKAGLSPAELRAVITKNEAAYASLQPVLDEIFGSTLSAKRLPGIGALVAERLQAAAEHSFAAIILGGLAEAVAAARAAGVTKAIGKWRDAHTVIENGKRVLKSASRTTQVRELIDLYERYQAELAAQGLYDYDDMILEATAALEQQPDIRLDLAERFQYIMVDEFQDTNGAQNRLLRALLEAHPLDSPNVLVVGDDEQAIMRFQGAEVSGILEFAERFQPRQISLSENYRSGQMILDAARQIIVQTDDRLEVALPDGFTKRIVAKAEPARTVIEHRSYASPSAEYAAVAAHVAGLLEQGVPAGEIAIIGRKHPELKTFAPYLAARGIAVNYDKRESVLEDEYIRQLLALAALVHMLAEKPARAEVMLPAVLAAPYWQLPGRTLYDIALAAKTNKQSWLEAMLGSEQASWQAIAEWLLAAAKSTHTRNFTQTFDILIGRETLADTGLKASPFARYFAVEPAERYTALLSHLIRLRSAVLSARPTARGLADLLDVVSEYRRSGTELIDDNPLLRGGEGKVTVLSAHAAKGREFEHVIILSATDNTWGPRSHGNNNHIPLPENLQIYPAGDNDSDKLRLLYVAMTRAKSHLLFTSYRASDEGKPAVPLSYLQLGDDRASWWQPRESAAPDVREVLETTWRATSAVPPEDLRTLLRPALANFRISPSAVRTYLDIRYGGPLAAIEQHVLKFPSAYNRHSALGEAAHEMLARAQQASAARQPLATDALLNIFDAKVAETGLTEADTESVRLAGHDFLPAFLAQFDMSGITAAEQYFTAKLPGYDTPIGGKIDALKQHDGTLDVIDYKTGVPPETGWQGKGATAGKQVGLHFYRQQLLFYKLLLDNSPAANGASVTSAELVFVEPDSHGNFIRLTLDSFDAAELKHVARFIAAVYERIMRVSLPDTSGYARNLAGIKAFEQDIVEGRI